MRIVRADIFGFGKWVDKTFHFPDQSLICFYGENESGKTTLQQFIIFMLFGFPPRKRASFKPKMSSKLGGRLILHHSSIGQFSIERLDDELICLLPDGSQQGEEWLDKQLNRMTEDMYRSIYSFSALDLSDIQDMKDDSLGEILFSIGLTGATNIYTVERNIDRKIGDLFKPTGRVPAINKQLSTLDNLYKKSIQYERQEASYRANKEEQLSILNRLSNLEHKLQTIKKDLFTYEKIRHALPTIQEYHRYNDKLKLIDHQLSFPENGIERLNALKKELIPLQSECELLSETKQQYENILNNIEQQLHPDENYLFAQSLINEKQIYSDQKQLLASTKEKLNRLNEQVEEMIEQLNIDLSEDEILNMSFPFQIETTWIELSKEDELLQLEHDQLLEEEHILLRKKEKLNEEKAILTNKLLPDEQIQSLSAKLAQDEQVKVQLREKTVKENDWNRSKTNRLKKSKTILYSTVLFALMSLVIGMIFKSNLFYVFTIFSALIGFVQHYMTNQSIKEMDILINNSSTSKTINRLSEKERIQIKRLIEQQEKCKNELYLVERSIKDLHIDELKWEERELLYRQKRTKHNQLIDEQQIQFPFLNYVSVSHWLDLLDALKQLKVTIETKYKVEKNVVVIKDDINQFKDKINHFLEEVNLNTQTESLTIIEEWLQNERDLLRQKEQYTEFLSQTENKQKQIEKELATYVTEMNDLFSAANVQDEDEFFEVHNRLKTEQDLTDKKNMCLQQISLTFSEADQEKVLNNILNENEVELTIRTLIEDIDETEKEIKQNRDKLAKVEATLKQMETSDDFSEIVHHIEIEQQKLTELALEWTVLQTAKTALDKSKMAYRNKYLTEVIEKTSSYFSLITDGAYIKVFPPTKKESFLVQTPDYTRYDVKELSQGTVDQLYVSLRLAISEVMSERYNVPFIIDDAFVHFDFKRTKNIAHILLEIGKKQQVIFFTCKEDIKQLIPNDTVININDTVSVH